MVRARLVLVACLLIAACESERRYTLDECRDVAGVDCDAVYSACESECSDVRSNCESECGNCDTDDCEEVCNSACSDVEGNCESACSSGKRKCEED